MLSSAIIVSMSICSILTVLISVGKLAVFKKEDDVVILPLFVISIGFILIFYSFSVIFSAILLLTHGHIFFGMVFVIFIFLPFIIGYYSNYKRINLFMNLQIVELTASMIVSFVIWMSLK